jgi:hypothetical protein
MSVSDENFVGDPREVEFTMSESGKVVKGAVINNDEGELDVQIPVAQFGDQSELKDILSEDEAEVVAVWTRIADKVTKQLPEEGMSLLAWVRVKKKDGTFSIKKDEGMFVAKTAMFSLGAIAAIEITRRVVHHYKSR